MKDNYASLLSGARGITYLMFLRKDETHNVVELLSKRSIITEDPIYQYINKLEKRKVLETIYALSDPGPPKIREEKTLDPIFETASLYRVWKITAKGDKREFSSEERAKMTALFKSVSHFLDCFPDYFYWGIRTLGKKTVRTIEWRETLKIFLQFCEELVKICWEIENYGWRLVTDYHLRHVPRTKKDSADSYLVAFGNLSKIPYLHICNAYAQKTISDQHIADLAGFSKKGHKDIYLKDTHLRELHLLSIALADPFFALSFHQSLEDIEAVLWEERLNEINVVALNRAISEKAREISTRITEFLTNRMQEELKIKDRAAKAARHRQTEELRRNFYSLNKDGVNRLLKKIVESTGVDMTEKELERALVNLRVGQFLGTLRLKPKGAYSVALSKE